MPSSRVLKYQKNLQLIFVCLFVFCICVCLLAYFLMALLVVCFTGSGLDGINSTEGMFFEKN